MKARKRKPTKLDALRASLPSGYSVSTWSPGDGQTRYRFFKNAPSGQTYFGPANGIYTALGFREAETFASGLHHSGDPSRRKKHTFTKKAVKRIVRATRSRRDPLDRSATRITRERPAFAWELWYHGDTHRGRKAEDDGYVASYKDKGEAQRHLARLKRSHPYARYYLKHRRVPARHLFGGPRRAKARWQKRVGW